MKRFSKKVLQLFVILISISVLAACQNTPSPDEQENKPVVTSSTARKETKATAEESSATPKATLADDFEPMSEEEMELAAKNKDDIRYETVKYYSMANTPKKTIKVEIEVAGVGYTGELSLVKIDVNSARQETSALYQGILSAED